MRIIADYQLSESDRSPLSWSERASVTAKRGFSECELCISPAGVLTLDADPDECAAVAGAFRAAGVRVAALYADLGGKHGIFSPAQADRNEAEQVIISMLRRAAWLEADLLSLSPLDSPPDGAPPDGPRSAEILTEAARALARIGAEAETHGTRVAVSAPRTGSPSGLVEMGELIDRVNSPWVGVCLNADRCPREIGAAEWAVELGWRLAAIRLGPTGCKDHPETPAGLVAAVHDYARNVPLFLCGELPSEWIAPTRPENA